MEFKAVSPRFHGKPARYDEGGDSEAAMLDDLLAGGDESCFSEHLLTERAAEHLHRLGDSLGIACECDTSVFDPGLHLGDDRLDSGHATTALEDTQQFFFEIVLGDEQCEHLPPAARLSPGELDSTMSEAYAYFDERVR